MITATATQLVLENKEQDLLALMKDLTAKVKANEPGCALFMYVRAKDKERTYLVIEQYVDQKAFDFHHSTDYLKSFIPKMMECLEKPPDVVLYEDAFNSRS